MEINQFIYDNDKGKLIKYLIIFTIILSAMFIFLGSFYVVQAGERAILLTLGKPSLDAKSEGFHLKIPMIQRAVKMDVKTQKYEIDASAASQDLQIVSSKIAVNYHLTPDFVPILYKEIGINYQERVIAPAVQEIVKASTAQFTAEQLITKRAEVQEKIKLGLIDRLLNRNIIVESISIINFDFSKSFNDAIEAKVTAEQLKLKADNDLQRIKVEAEQKVVSATAEAQSITIQSKALRDNPDILQLRAIEKWNGIMPLYTGNAMPFIQLQSTQI